MYIHVWMYVCMYVCMYGFICVLQQVVITYLKLDEWVVSNYVFLQPTHLQVDVHNQQVYRQPKMAGTQEKARGTPQQERRQPLTTNNPLRLKRDITTRAHSKPHTYTHCQTCYVFEFDKVVYVYMYNYTSVCICSCILA